MFHRLTSACALALLSAVLLHADDNVDQSKLLALENAWNLAQVHGDDKALRSLVADDYVYTDYDGTVMNKAQFLADLKDPDYKATVVTNENVKVFAYRNAAIVIGTYHSKGTYKRQPFDHWGRFTDSWIFNNGKWQCIATHTNLVKNKKR